MSNLVKSRSVYNGENKRVIDSNEAIINKLSKIKNELSNGSVSKDGFSLGLNAEHVEELLDENEAEQQGEDLEKIRAESEKIIEDAKNTASQIVERARVESVSILENAAKQSESIKEKARQEGLKQGFDEGSIKLQELQQKIIQDGNDKIKKIDEQYQEKIKKMEPELVDVILDVVENVVKVSASDKKEVIISLIDGVLGNAETSGNFIVKVSKEDFSFVRENKEKILKSVNKDISIEVIEDPLIGKNQCIIDTDIGIFDCSLDIQLEKLIRDIKIMSCTR